MSNKSARQALREERARQAARAKRRERLVLIGVGVAVVILIIAIAGIVQWQRSQVSGDAVAPAGVAPGYGKATQGGENGLGQGIGIGDPDAPVVVEVFEDFSCPHCRDFEARSSHVLRQRVASGDVRVVYYPVTLSQFGEPTVRSANAFACAADQRKAREMHDALYANFSQSWSSVRPSAWTPGRSGRAYGTRPMPSGSSRSTRPPRRRGSSARPRSSSTATRHCLPSRSARRVCKPPSTGRSSARARRR